MDYVFFMSENMNWGTVFLEFLPSHSLELISSSPYCLLHNSYDVILEKLVLNQQIIL